MLARLLLILALAFIAVSAGFSQNGGGPFDDANDEINYLATWDAATFPALVRLGEKLFFDPGLSRSGHTSCATCHNPNFAFADPRRTSIFDSGKIGRRNGPSILTAPYMPRLMWDGRFGSLEAQVSGPLSANGEMGTDIREAAARISSDPEYRQLFWQTYGTPPTAEGIAGAIAAFERSLISGWSRFDRFTLKHDNSALNGFERFGFDLFTGKARCVICHRLPAPNSPGYALFTDFRYHNLGVGYYGGRFIDGGLGKISGRPQDIGAYRTPSLRNVAVTAPYMHDGSLPSLREVVEFYNAGGVPNPFKTPLIRPLRLSEQEKAALVAFLNTLTTEDFLRSRSFRGRPGASLEFDP